MLWFIRLAKSDRQRVERNLERLENLRVTVHDLGYFAVASNSGGHMALEGILEDQLVLGRPKVHEKLKSALIGENNQKVALDAPTRFQRYMNEAEELIKREIGIEQRKLREFGGEELWKSQANKL